MNQSGVLVPTRYNIFLQKLDKDHIELEFLGFVNTISEARTMVKIFREVIFEQSLNATVVFEHAKI